MDHHQVTNRIAEELQSAAMEMRMLPVGVVFGRFPRMVRDISRRLEKQVSLITEGEDTAADKDVLELLADPLVHLVRNSLDHGLETPQERKAAGKPPEGRLTLRASQEADGVLVEVIDDGRGIDPENMRRVARERGIAADGLSDQEARELILAPGFSTAQEISDLSGRGVGMDAVRAVIDKLGGSINLASDTGQGTTVSLRLPLSMAVTRVMVVGVGGQRFGVPVEHVVPHGLEAAYAASKAYVVSFSESVGHDLRGTGVTCTHLAPGPTRTEFFPTAGLLDDSRLGRAMMDAATVAAAGYAAMRAGRASVMPGLGTKAMRAAVALSPSKRLTGLVSGYFVTRR